MMKIISKIVTKINPLPSFSLNQILDKEGIYRPEESYHEMRVVVNKFRQAFLIKDDMIEVLDHNEWSGDKFVPLREIIEIRIEG